ARAFELAALGQRQGAHEALAWGLVNRVYAAGEFDEQAARFVAELASRPPGALARVKRLLHELDGLDFDAGLARAVEVNVEARLSEECRGGVRAFLERSRPPAREGGR